MSIFACSSPANENIDDSTVLSTELQDQLQAKQTSFEQKADNEKKRVYAQGIKAVEESGVLQKAISTGDKAPNFVLTNAKGEKTSLYENLKNGPVVLTWYRGGWCPYCNITLAQLQKDLPKFTALGARIMALTPELPDSSINTAQKNALKFDVLSDLGNKVAEQYGVVYTLTPDVATRYQEGFGLHEYNGDKSNKLPLAATYVIGTDRIIKFTFLRADYRKRAEPSVLLEVLKGLK